MELIEKPESELSRSDLRMLGTAVRRGWEIPDEALEKVPKKMFAIVNQRKGSNREKIAAANVLAAMVKNSQPKLVGHLHQHNHNVIEKPEESLESLRASLRRRTTVVARLSGDA